MTMKGIREVNRYLSNRDNCAKKRPYDTLSKARKARASLMQSLRWDGRPIDVYQCMNCAQFHIGHRKKVIDSHYPESFDSNGVEE